MRLTADGALAVHHDAEIPALGTIAELEVADLPAHVPLLADVLAVCEGMVVNVEIKNAPQDPGWDPGEAVAALTAAAIDEAGWTARVIVSSFQTATLRAVQAADGRLALGRALGLRRRGRAGAGRGRGGRVRRRPPLRGVGRPRAGERAHAMGLAVNVWTVNAPDDLRAMVAAGVDAVITDRLAEALAVAGGRRPERAGRRSPVRGRSRKRARHRAEWRGTALVHKDGPP